MLYILPNPFYKRAFKLSQKRYISKSMKLNRRGDIIVFKDPTSGFYSIKRVIGLPGDEIRIIKGNVYVNGRPLNERYRPVKDSFNYGPKKVPAESYFVLGDNRPAASDSRMWGMLPSNKIIGPVVMRIWPISRFRSVK
jgi:signal peptidase I